MFLENLLVTQFKIVFTRMQEASDLKENER